MKKTFFSLLIFSFSFTFSQSIESLFEQQKYDDLIKYETKTDSLSGEELYYIGYAFFRKENDEKAIELYNKAIEKGFNNPIIFFQKGFSLMFLNKLDEAIKNYDLAISQAPKAKFYIEKGRIFNKQGKNNEEIQTYLEGLEKSHKDSFYLELTKITGNYYYARTKEFDKSINIYKKGIENFPEDYILYEKLIKALNASNKFDEANEYFEHTRKLYQEKKLSDDYMKYKNIAVDEFEWNGQWINIFKSFEKPKEILDSLYKVYLIDKSGKKIERKFNIEKTIKIEKKDPEFVVCEELNNGHNTYPIGLKDETFKLSELRQIIVSILNKKQKEAATIRFNQ